MKNSQMDLLTAGFKANILPVNKEKIVIIEYNKMNVHITV